MIREKDIDHQLARAASESDKDCGTFMEGLRKLFANRNILYFTVAICLWNLANGFMLPLLGQKLGQDNAENSAVYLAVCIIVAQAFMIGVAPLAAKASEKGRKNIFLIAFLLVPLRAALFSWIDNKYALISFQVIDGIGAGIYGVLSILMMSDLAKGTGRFNLLQGTTYAAVGLGVALSSASSGFTVKAFGYPGAFLTLGGIGVVATLFFFFFVREPDESAPSAVQA